MNSPTRSAPSPRGPERRPRRRFRAGETGPGRAEPAARRTPAPACGRLLRPLATAAVLALAMALAPAATRPAAAHGTHPTGHPTGHTDGRTGPGTSRGWVAAWGASQVAGSDIPWSDCPAGKGLEDQTVRNVLFVKGGGSSVRVRITNTFGTQPVAVGKATVALQDEGAGAVPGTLRTLTFGGREATTLAAGEERFSDPVRLPVRALSTLLVSVHVDKATGPVTNHPFTAQGNHLADGDKTADPSGDGYADTPCWMLVSGVDVRADHRTIGSVVAFGDSITDTASTTGNANQRYPDHLARRFQVRTGPTLSVVNAGLGGNRLIADREGEPYYGVSGLSRMERDAFTQSGVRSVILMEGINDIGYDATADELIAGYKAFIEEGHRHGVQVHGGTLLPMAGSFIWTERRQAVWDAVNDWIRTSGAFDGVIDFAAATASPDDPLTLDPAYDSGDHLHPNDAGTRAMAEAVDLDMLLAAARDRTPGAGRPS
ncbi:SGNH/GDSL hydrolase family protein [Streptomyces sp. F63]|uniref:SGNH/GDSL hydrolase family protein n=1 Tax=Streptomyces sp. F63 TaxID=2824887 RepID=UPI001B390C5F|nr:SGNH/GDSL hydrolase family protein [Streptomyces sp. F63]MBQ0986929.1 SGNH/GDSL hydrolase family protein [Streptomyces sp. F63]